MLEYSDFPMEEKRFSVKEGEHIPGKVLHEYFHAYAENFGILEKTRFGAKVVSCELVECRTWVVTYAKNEEKDGEEALQVSVKGRKLVLATGSTSQEYLPTFKGMERFKGQHFHSKETSWRKGDMEKAKNIVVVGGSKSAADAVYMNASEGRHVDWVIRGIFKFYLHKSPNF